LETSFQTRNPKKSLYDRGGKAEVIQNSMPQSQMKRRQSVFEISKPIAH